MKFEMIKPILILIVLWLLGLALFALMSGCKTSDPVEVPKVEPTKVQAKNVVLAWGEKQEVWTTHLLNELSNREFLTITPKDFKDWCPSYPSLTTKDRAEVIAQLISVMAQRESGFNPKSKFQEAFFDSKGKPVISRGLLQISIESANSYGCGFKDAKELHDPLKNLSCSVKIIERWVTRNKQMFGMVDGKWRGGCSSYWSVCRSGSRSYPVVTGYVKGLSLCR
jgi:hypothetical protein